MDTPHLRLGGHADLGAGLLQLSPGDPPRSHLVTPPPPPADLHALVRALGALEARLTALEIRVSALEAAQAPGWLARSRDQLWTSLARRLRQFRARWSLGGP